MADTEPQYSHTAAAPDAANSGARPDKTRLYKLGFVAAFLLLIASFLIHGNDTITKPYVESQLEHLAEHIAEQAQISGDEAAFTYGEVSVQGGFLRSQITVANPRLIYVAHLPFGNVQKTDVTTSKALVSGDMSAQSLAVYFPDTFEIARDEYAPISLGFVEVPHYEFSNRSGVEAHVISLPPGFTMTTHAPGSDPVQVKVDYTMKPILKRIIHRKENKSETEVNFRDVKIASSTDDGLMKFKQLHFSSSEKPLGVDARHFSSIFKLDQFGVATKDAIKGPYDFILDINGTYLAPKKTADAYQEVRDMEITIDKLGLVHKDYNVTISGALSVKPDDIMPFGLLNIGIKGLDTFRSSEFVPVANVALKDAVISEIVGNEDVTLKDTFFTLKREKNGTLFIGDTSFENLVGLVITHGLAGNVEENAVEEEGVKPDADPAEAPKPEIPAKAAPLPPIEEPGSAILNTTAE